MAEIRSDVLGEGYLAETIDLPADDEGPVRATLVRRVGAGDAGQIGAVLHVHGFNDYFFQTAYADWWTERGYAFYALDLRKYGRSLDEHQTPNYVTDLGDYGEELDQAWRLVTERDGHTRVVLSAHSTGGLILPLWAEDRRPAEAVAMVLNSPWLDLRGSLFLRTVGTRIVDRVGAWDPRRIIPRELSGLYGQSLHRDYGGEWDYHLPWKPITSWPVRVGWLRAIRRGHAELHRGLHLPFPILVLTSGATTAPTVMGEDVHATDIVLDVRQMWRWAPCLGRHLTLVALEGARHDVVLSRRPVRERAYDELDRWRTAYVDRVPADLHT